MLLAEDFRKSYDINISNIDRNINDTYIINSDIGKYFLKKINNKHTARIFKFVRVNKFENTIYPMRTKEDEYLSDINDENYLMLPWVEKIDYPEEKSLIDLLKLLKKLHEKTVINRVGSNRDISDYIDFQKYKMNKVFNVCDLFIAECEEKIYNSPVEWIYLYNYNQIINVKRLLLKLEQKLSKLIKEKDIFTLSIVHRKPYLEHLLISNDNFYLVSIDNCKIGCPILDYVRLFINYIFVNIDWVNELEKVLTTEFDKYYFGFNLIYMYITSFDIFEINTRKVFYGVNKITSFFEGLKKINSVLDALTVTSDINNNQQNQQNYQQT